MCKSYFMSMEIFMGMGMGMENFCGGMYFYVGHGIFFLTWDFLLVLDMGFLA